MAGVAAGRGTAFSGVARDARIIAVQVFINVAINIRLIPVTGIPLPFISTGNSSLLVFFIGLGLLQSVLAWQDDARRGPVY